MPAVYWRAWYPPFSLDGPKYKELLVSQQRGRFVQQKQGIPHFNTIAYFPPLDGKRLRQNVWMRAWLLVVVEPDRDRTRLVTPLRSRAGHIILLYIFPVFFWYICLFRSNHTVCRTLLAYETRLMKTVYLSNQT